METKNLLIGKGELDLSLIPKMANRHGLVAGATGTGKTVTIQVMAEKFSQIGVPVFVADVKGDLSGLSQEGNPHPKIDERIQKMNISDFNFAGSPVTFWDVFGEKGHPLKTTVSEMGPLLFARLMNLNETQTGVLSIIFRVADDKNMLLLDTKDLHAMAQHVADNATEYKVTYGNISPASIGTIQRGILQLEDQGAKKFFGEPAVSLDDFIQTDNQGRGIINILDATTLMQNPRIYATLLLWILSELFENLPEVGDPEKPKLVFFFEEAHLLFDETPKVLQDKIEQVVRLIRSKGVGIYFVSQNPLDIPDDILGQLGNRVQHALRAFTPRDQKAVNAAADTFRPNPKIDIKRAITELGLGEALISFLNEKGQPSIVDRGLISPPSSKIGPTTEENRKKIIQKSVLFGVYEKEIDRESAYELLLKRRPEVQAENTPTPKTLEKTSGRGRQTILEAMTKSAARAASSQLGRTLVRGLLGGLLGGAVLGSRRRRRK